MMMYSYEYRLLCDFDKTRETGETHLLEPFLCCSIMSVPSVPRHRRSKCAAWKVEGVLFMCRLQHPWIVNSGI
jgi:hypothetical protein